MTTFATFGRYELRGELGWGGFATVYRAWDPALKREVALKALQPHLARDRDMCRRFLAEAQALARLDHRNIVAVYDVGEADGRPFFAMALIQGQTLAQVLAGRRKLSLPEVSRLLPSLAGALDEIHRQGLVHRDLRPQNVMLEGRSDGTTRLVLMDFGIARDLGGPSLTSTQATMGTAPYMAPEQVRSGRVGPAADIYALGVLTYQFLAGRTPFVGDTPAILYAHVWERPPPLRDLQPGLPESVYSAIDAALAKEPAQRPASARQFVDRLRLDSRARPQPGPPEPRPVPVGADTVIQIRPAPTKPDEDVRVTPHARDRLPQSRQPGTDAIAAFARRYHLPVPNLGLLIAGLLLVIVGTAVLIARRDGEGAQVTTLASHDTYFEGGPGVRWTFGSVWNLAVDGAGNVYVASSFFSPKIYKIKPDGTVTILAGTEKAGFADGPAAMAQFSDPDGIAVDGAGNIYVADISNDRVRKIKP